MADIPTLSILDATAVGPGVTATQALAWTTEIAKLAEELNYRRLWVVEHHGVSDIGCSTPAVLMAHLAGQTRRLRIGSGGVMLLNHAPFVVAEQFKMLEGLYPGRIDLGIGKSRGGDAATTLALQREQKQQSDFDAELDELHGFLDGGFPSGHRFETVQIPLRVAPPPVYLLGASPASAAMAGGRGLPFAYAHHLNPHASRESVAKYRSSFRHEDSLKRPHAILTVAVVCADSLEEAQQAALKAAIVRLRSAAVRKQSLSVSSEALLCPRWSPLERQLAEKELEGEWVLVGNPEQIGRGLRRLSQTTRADELMLTTIEYDGPSRVRTLRAVGELLQETQAVAG